MKASKPRSIWFRVPCGIKWSWSLGLRLSRTTSSWSPSRTPVPSRPKQGQAAGASLVLRDRCRTVFTARTLCIGPSSRSRASRRCAHSCRTVHYSAIGYMLCFALQVARNHIHLAPGLPEAGAPDGLLSASLPIPCEEDGKIRGMRSTAELFLYIDVPAAMLDCTTLFLVMSPSFPFSRQDGMIFYRSKNEVILTQGHASSGFFEALRYLALASSCTRLDGWLPVKYFIKVACGVHHP